MAATVCPLLAHPRFFKPDEVSYSALILFRCLSDKSEHKKATKAQNINMKQVNSVDIFWT